MYFGKSFLNQIIGNQCITEEFIYSLYEGRGKSKLKSTPMEMYEALNGKIRGHHVILLGMHNSNIVFLEKQINELEKEIDILLQKERDSLELLESQVTIGSGLCCVSVHGQPPRKKIADLKISTGAWFPEWEGRKH